MPAESSYGRLLKDSRFEAFLATQFFSTIVLVCLLKLTAASPVIAIPFLLLAVVAGLFISATYGILPNLVAEAQIARANGLLQLATLAAVLIGSFLHPRTNLVLLGIAIAGVLASLGIRRVPAARPAETFHWNPLHEVIARKSLALALCGISWFWFAAAFFLLTQPLTSPHLAVLAAGFGLGSIAAGALSGDYIELALVPAGLALMAVPSPLVIGFGAGLFIVPLNAYLQREAPAAMKGRILATSNFANMLAAGFMWLVHGRIHNGISVLGVIMLLAAVVLTIRMPETIARFVLWCVAMTIFRIRLEGRENIPRTGAALLVSNHISYADAVLVGCTTRLRTVHFLMWQPIFDVPVANYFFRVLQAIPIDAASPKSTVRALHAARAQLQRGEIVGIFPEGSISRTGEIERFERGFERILQGTDAPVIPIHIDGLWGHPFSCKAGAPFRSWEKVWRPTVTVRIGAPIHALLNGTELRQSVVNLAARQVQ
jgi:acyl-[acyl-carrier-protein]-phospholipid O-acyltransferase/long-chain-fatty-acid--[acyl-carrier-protein] ligase